MMRATTLLALTFGLALLTGCGEEAPPAASTSGEQHGHTHDDDHAHDDDHNHDHGDDAGHHSGPKHELGSQQVGPYTVEVKQVGEVEAGQPATFEIVLAEQTPRPSAVRAWVGNEQAIGSVKVRAVQRPAFYDADLEVPATMPEDSRLWVEIEMEDGQRHFGSFELHE